MQVRYGHKWTINLPTKELKRLAVVDWSAGLAEFSDEDIERGFGVLDGAWPPSLGEFRVGCKVPRALACHRMRRALPHPPCDPAIASDELAKMRLVMRGR